MRGSQSAAMTFAEIGAELGVSRSMAYQIYATAMRKIRRIHGRRVQDLLAWIETERRGGR